MACSMIKKGLVGATLGAGALYLAFGTSTPSYVKTAFHRVRETAKSNVSVPFEIERARDQIAGLDPVIRDNMEKLAREEEEVKGLHDEILAIRGNLAKEGNEIVALRTSLQTGEFKLTGRVSYTEEEIVADLNHRFNHYKQVEQVLGGKENTLKSKEKAVAAARQQLNNMLAQRQTLATKLDEIEARHNEIEASKTLNEFHFDDSALSHVKQTVSDLDKRLNVMARVSELEGRLAEKGIPIVTEPSKGDVVKEIDAKFGTAPKRSGEAASEKSL